MRVSEILKKCLRNKNFILGSCMVGLMVLIMVVGFFYMPYDPDVMDTEHELQFFSAAHPLGTDDVGRDLLARLLYGGRVSLLIGLSSAAISACLGTFLGLMAGYRRGVWEFCIMRLADIFQSFPSIVLVLCLVGGKQGLKGALGLVFTFFCILFVYLPLVYRGWSPFWVAVLICIVTTLVTMYLIGGPTRKTVVAAGGIADGRGVAAAFMLGAVGVQLGTRFLVAEECGVHQTYKNKILKAKDIDTIATGKRLGHPVRCLKTPYSREYFRKEYDGSVSDEELEAFGAGALRKAAVEGDEQHGCFLAGQIAAMVKKEQPAAEIIREIFTEAEKVLNGATKWVR